MSESQSASDEAREALDRLYDHPSERIDALQELGSPDRDIEGEAALFKTLGNENRLRVLLALRESECCGCELQVALDAPQSTVATHLRKLKEAGIVSSRKKGKWSYYRITDTAVLELLDLVEAIQEEI